MKISDLHNDLITELPFQNALTYLEDNSTYIDKIILAVWTTHTKYNNYLSISSLIEKYRLPELETKILFGIEDISAIEEKYYERLKELNLFYASLTWNYDNCLGGGALGDSGL